MPTVAPAGQPPRRRRYSRPPQVERGQECPCDTSRCLGDQHFLRSITNVTSRRPFFCYTAVNAFATVCSLSGDPVGSASPPHFLPAVWFQRQFHCERHANSDQCV